MPREGEMCIYTLACASGTRGSRLLPLPFDTFAFPSLPVPPSMQICLCCYDDFNLGRAQTSKAGLPSEGERPRLWEYTLDPASGQGSGRKVGATHQLETHYQV